jgi:glutamate--cysteine ligase
LRDGVPKGGLATPFRKATVREVAQATLQIAEQGLKRRAQLTSTGQDESAHLETIWQVVRTGQTTADELLALYQGRWAGKIAPIFDECRF